MNEKSSFIYLIVRDFWELLGISDFGAHNCILEDLQFLRAFLGSARMTLSEKHIIIYDMNWLLKGTMWDRGMGKEIETENKVQGEEQCE